MNYLLLIFVEFILPIAYKLSFRGFNQLFKGVSYGGMALVPSTFCLSSRVLYRCKDELSARITE
ncbi:hypothetical protein FBY33_2856 [Arthrobacter sp. SLBN-112]|nr:hypothetical protein FBY33_2856 [Arthrobacter sp. SLBN-112]